MSRVKVKSPICKTTEDEFTCHVAIDSQKMGIAEIANCITFNPKSDLVEGMLHSDQVNRFDDVYYVYQTTILHFCSLSLS